MTKTILITGATDGIGLETAKLLASGGHTLLLHGRSETKLEDAKQTLSKIDGVGAVETYRADLSKMPEVEALASAISENHTALDVLINNAGVFKMPNPQTGDGYDARFVVNTVAPYLLTKNLLSLLPSDGRVVNLSSAAQSSVDLAAMTGNPAATMTAVHLRKSRIMLRRNSRGTGRLPLILCLLLGWPVSTAAQDWQAVEIETIPVADNIFMLRGRGGNIVSSRASISFLISVNSRT